MLDGLHELRIPEPVGGFEDVMEYDRRRMLREQLAEAIIETALETGRAVRLLGSVTGRQLEPFEGDPPWAPLAPPPSPGPAAWKWAMEAPRSRACRLP